MPQAEGGDQIEAAQMGGGEARFSASGPAATVSSSPNGGGNRNSLAREAGAEAEAEAEMSSQEGGAGPVGEREGHQQALGEPSGPESGLTFHESIDELTAMKDLDISQTESIIKSPSLNHDQASVLRRAEEMVVKNILPQFESLVERRKGYEDLLRTLQEDILASRSLSFERISDELSIIQNASSEALDLQNLAISATKKILEDSEESWLHNEEASKIELRASLDKLSRDYKAGQAALRVERLQGVLEEARNKAADDNQRRLLSSESWSDAGYFIDGQLEEEKSLTAISNVPLHTYLLRDDSKGDVVMGSKRFNQRRTRRHVGVIDKQEASAWLPESDDAGSIDSSTVFAYNLKALSQLANSVDEVASSIDSLSSSSVKQNATLRLQRVEQIIVQGDGEEPPPGEKWKSAAQLAAETMAVESEASLSEMNLLAHRFKATIKGQISQMKHYSRLSLLDETDISTARSVEAAKLIETQREADLLKAEANLDVAINRIISVGKIISMKNDTMRELLRLKESSLGEAERLRARVLSDAKLERDTEGASIKRIRAAGKEATKATIEIIRVAFVNFAIAIEHTFQTSQGQKQLLTLILGLCMLAFSTILVKEVSGLLFVLVKKAFLTPKLVREFGRARYRRRNKDG